jgi:hypothetical protein
MKKIFIVTILTIFVFSEDFSLGILKQNDNFLIPKFDTNMSYEEFDILSTQINIKDIGYSLIVPGYIHYKAHDTFNTYVVAGIRGTAYATMMYLYFNSVYNKSSKGDTGSFFANYYNMSDNDKISFGWALNISIVTWLYDWIHGINELKTRQNIIRYKYGLKFNLIKRDNNLVGANVAIGAKF